VISVEPALPLDLDERDFRRLRDMLHAHAGIDLGPEKKALVANRLNRRLRALGLETYRAYTDLVLQPAQDHERQTAIDLLTTNETYFFREPQHFSFLKQWIASEDRPGRQWRIWSAACSSGEEPYSIAMTMAEAVGAERYEVIASDISRRVLARAEQAHYPMVRLDHFPVEYLRRYCLKGIGPEDGTLLIDQPVRRRVAFRAINLMERLPELGALDAVFLRNALIYFNREDRQAILRRVQAVLRPGGHLFVSHSESLHGLVSGLDVVQPSVYCRPL
jgi:chemotaxis protein methyltransferase CheR